MVTALRPGLVPSRPEGASSSATQLAVQASKVDTFAPIGAEDSHIGFLIHGFFKNTAGEITDLPKLYFRIRKIDPNHPASHKELLVALTALNQFVDQHRHMSRANFERYMETQHGQSFFFGVRENVESELNPVKNPEIKYFSGLRHWFNTTILKKQNIVHSIRFYAPDSMLNGRIHNRSKRTTESYENEHFISEFSETTKKALEDDARDLTITPMRSPEPETSLVFREVDEEHVHMHGRYAGVRHPAAPMPAHDPHGSAAMYGMRGRVTPDSLIEARSRLRSDAL